MRVVGQEQIAALLWRIQQRVRCEIAPRFDGRNVRALARDYGLTPRYVRPILSAFCERS